MNQIYPDIGLIPLLQLMVSSTLHLNLFTNNITPDRSTVVGGLNVATWSGYAQVSLTSGDFTASGVVGHVGFLLAPPKSFANASGSPQSAYGYYLTDASDTILLAIARFDSAPITKADGEFFFVAPIIGDSSRLLS